ncbi:regulator of chromosome condensation 1/beta-lactamase-inhibitor protein II [Gorgonomyces haynaldii]|nr:regulator of chromosome condensation 1/beta-lactamase-inhibitor protein II [Gorgonomyces haynaldii]
MTDPKKGLLVYCGSAAWEYIGRKPPASQKHLVQDLEFPEPHIYGPAYYINVASVHTHCTASHNIIIDDQGAAYIFGRNEKGQLGNGTLTPSSEPKKIEIKDEVFVDAAVGRNFSVLVAKSGKVYACGENKSAQCGKRDDPKDQKSWIQVPIKEHVTKVACGADFAVAINDKGEVFAWGSPQYGQCGDGSDHKYIAGTNREVYDPQPPKPVKGLAGKKIVKISCGANHTLSLDEDGAMFTWGAASYGRLGLNESPPKDAMVAKEIEGFANRNNPVTNIACGGTFSMCTDSRHAIYLWGKWKNSGDGGQGTPWLYPKHFQGLSGWHVRDLAGGQSALYALAEKSTISWGQNCFEGELGHGAKKPRSATNAVKVDALEDFTVLSVSVGNGQALLIVDRDDPKVKDLPVALVQALILEQG